MADVIKIRPTWEKVETKDSGDMVFEYTSEVMGEKLEAHTHEELRDKMLAKLVESAASMKEPDRALATKRIEAKLAAKERL